MSSKVRGSLRIVPGNPHYNLEEELWQIWASEKNLKNYQEIKTMLLIQAAVEIKMCCLLSEYGHRQQAHFYALHFKSSGSNDSCLNKLFLYLEVVPFSLSLQYFAIGNLPHTFRKSQLAAHFLNTTIQEQVQEALKRLN